MPSFSDSALIVFLALLLFGPKKLPELARQLGKLMAEFRRASNEFRMQMDEELRLADQAEQQKKIAAMEAAAPPTPALVDTVAVPVTEDTIAAPQPVESAVQPLSDETLPIASSGDLNLMPPATGLPEPRSAISPVLDSIPQIDDPSHAKPVHNAVNESTEAPQHG